MSKFINEFKEFAVKGNAVDMAVGVIIGGAFGKIVSSIVDDIIMPPIGWLIGGVKFTDLKFTLPTMEIPGVEKMEAATINYGNFLQTAFDFVIIAFCVFLLVKGINKLTKKKTEENQIDPEYAAKLLDKYAANDAIFTVDTGMNVVWAARFIKGTGKRYLTGSFNHGSMANALPMAIGAAASSNGRQVVAMCGDGGLSMLLGDLATLMQYQYPVKIFVFNNRSLAMVKLEMEVSGYLDWQTNMVNPPFDKLAELMNIKGYEVRKTEDLEATVKAAFEHDGPTLVNIYTNRDTLAMPPHITFEQMKGFATNIIKKIGQGDFAEAKGSIANSMKHIKDVF